MKAITKTQHADTIPILKNVAVLGAGVMGAQIAAHFANAGISCLLFDLAAEGSDPSATARKAIKALPKQKPEPLALQSNQSLIQPCNYDDDSERLADCELIIEAIAERLEWKTTLYQRIAPYIHADSILASNTSGIALGELVKGVPENLQSQFLGIHFFNPPRYMHLVELIAQAKTDAAILDRMESFLTSTLGKGVVRANDTTNFIGNRIGLFSMMATLHHAERLGINFETVDALTGKAMGRPKSATLRTADLVGLDILQHVIHGVIQTLPDDPWIKVFHIPDWLDTLVEKGALGQKTRQGVYQKVGKDILVYDQATDSYRKRKSKVSKKVDKILKHSEPHERLTQLYALNDPQAEFLWSIHRDVFHYSAYLLADIADTARDVDFAIRWGFGWQQGPFESWQQSGWKNIAGLIQADINAGKTLSHRALPEWVATVEAVHQSQGSWSAKEGVYKPRSDLAVYKRQVWPERVLGESVPELDIVFENEVCRFWRVPHERDIGVMSFKTKMHTINDPLIASLHQALDIAEAELKGMIIWHPDEPFSAGADLKSFMPIALKSLLPGSTALDDLLQRFQGVCIRMRTSNIPVVAGIHGLALGGGCELLMQCDRVVAALESYVGLVEAGVGLIPAGSGCMELARRASLEAEARHEKDVFPMLKPYFETVAMGKVATSATQARDFGFLRKEDVIVMNKHEILYAAIAQVNALQATNYRPQIQRPILAGGREAIANFKAAMVNLEAGGFISPYDMKIGEYIAAALCGGEIDAGTALDEAWYLRLERYGFRQLLKNNKTHMRVKHMLETGKPLRN